MKVTETPWYSKEVHGVGWLVVPRLKMGACLAVPSIGFGVSD